MRGGGKKMKSWFGKKFLNGDLKERLTAVQDPHIRRQRKRSQALAGGWRAKSFREDISVQGTNLA